MCSKFIVRHARRRGFGFVNNLRILNRRGAIYLRLGPRRGRRDPYVMLLCRSHRARLYSNRLNIPTLLMEQYVYCPRVANGTKSTYIKVVVQLVLKVLSL